MIQVKIRKKKISKGRFSLFLDYYPPIPVPGQMELQRWEYLKLYIFQDPKSFLEKNHNKETLNLATTIQAQRQLDVQNESYNFISPERRKGNFLGFFEALAKKKIGPNADQWMMALRYLTHFSGGVIRYNQLTPQFAEQFKEYLLSGPALGKRQKPIGTNTSVSYFSKFLSALKEAYKAKLLVENVRESIVPIKEEDVLTDELNLEEIQRLAETPLAHPIIKCASLFACLTALRFTDIHTLCWSEVKGTFDGYYLLFRQDKTNGGVRIPISNLAYQLLGERGEESDLVLPGLHYSQLKTWLVRWFAAAGINKEARFHVFRHSNATVQITLGTDLFVVSKMLGHKSIRSTTRYAQVVDARKKEAADKIRINLNSAI